MAFPDYATQLRKLVAAHRENLADRVLLAVYYAPNAEPESADVCLLEVLERFDGVASTDRDLFRVAYASSPDFPITDGGRLVVTMTTPEELHTALRDDWRALADIRAAIDCRLYEIVCREPSGDAIADALLPAAVAA